jgi:hypothetical protein
VSGKNKITSLAPNKSYGKIQAPLNLLFVENYKSYEKISTKLMKRLHLIYHSPDLVLDTKDVIFGK